MPVIDCDAEAGKILSDLTHILGKSEKNYNDWEKMEQRILWLLNIAPDFCKAQFIAGMFYMRHEQSGLAINLFEQSIIRGKGKLGAAPWINLGIAHKLEHRDEKARECYQRALTESENEKYENMVENKVHAFNGLAGLHINAGSPATAQFWCDKALELDPTNRFAHWNKALAHLELGEWRQGFKLYDSAAFIASADKYMERKLKTYGGLPAWDGTPGKTVICYGEQGIGDEILFASMLPDLMKQCRVIIDCDKRLEQLFRRSFPDAEAVYPTSNVDAEFPWIKDHKVDAYVPMGSLGRWFRHKDADFPRTPFLIEDNTLRTKWNAELAKYGGLKIGISYCGGFKKTRQDKRTLSLPNWEPILKVPGCHFFSLQYHPWAADEAAQVGGKIGIPIHHWQDVIDDYNETAAFVKELDLVISVNTSLIHLCGSLGVPTLCLTPKYVAWRYGVKGPNPFYSSVKMIRQIVDDDWGPVIKRAVEILEKRTGKLKEAA